MNAVVHTFTGVAIFGSIKKDGMPEEMKKSLLVASVAGSLIPDIDVFSKHWDTNGMYQMWHRGITHSIFMVPVWAFLLWLGCFLVWKVKDKKVFYTALMGVSSHLFFDYLNAWGTGLLEPFSSQRFSLGTVSYGDKVIPFLLLAGAGASLLHFFRKRPSYPLFRWVWIFLFAYITVQSVQGYIVYSDTQKDYDRQVLAAQPVPGTFKMVGKKGSVVEIVRGALWTNPTIEYQFISKDDADLTPLFEKNPYAKALYRWSPFVVIIEDENELGIFDPRFYRNGKSFLYEWIKK